MPFCVLLVWLVGGIGVGCSAHGSAPPARPRPACTFGAPTLGVIPVSLEQVLAEPNRYAGKRIRLRVFLVNELENLGLYASEADARKPPWSKRSPRCGGARIGVKIPSLWWGTDHSHHDSSDTSKSRQPSAAIG